MNHLKYQMKFQKNRKLSKTNHKNDCSRFNWML